MRSRIGTRRRCVKSYIRKSVQEHDENSIAACFGDRLGRKEVSTSKLLAKSGRHLSPKCGSEAVLSLGSGIDWMENTEFVGVISVMPHGCMPGGIIAAMAETFSAVYHKPWISLTYDGFQETNNLARIHEFAELVKFYNRDKEATSSVDRLKIPGIAILGLRVRTSVSF